MSPFPARKQNKDIRRQQLIAASIHCLSLYGFAGTTMAAIAGKAGLSIGLVNFHFGSKENLLLETLLFMAQEYRLHWQSALNAAPKDAPSQLLALISADFTPPVCTPERLAAWGAFWGEVQSRPLYRDQIGANDQEYNDVLERLVRRMLDEHGYQGDAPRIARVLRVLAEGVWLDMMTKAQAYGPEEARATVMTGAAGLFAQHFSSQGLHDTSDK